MQRETLATVRASVCCCRIMQRGRLGVVLHAAIVTLESERERGGRMREGKGRRDSKVAELF